MSLSCGTRIFRTKHLLTSAWMVFIFVFAVSCAFAFYTDHAWEDWYITYRASKNLAEGNGLVYTIGEKVHSFTSPLGTLIPALLSFLTGNRNDDLVLWLFRVIGCCLRGLTAVILLHIAQSARMIFFPAALMIGLFALDAKIIDFSTNGQETAFMIFFLASALYSLLVSTKQSVVKLGLSWTGLMWTRPDSFVYIGGLVIGLLLFKPTLPQFRTRADMVRAFVLAGVMTAVLYSPWILWTWYYYGTPIPHTIIAKGLFIPGPDISLIATLLTFPLHTLIYNSSIFGTFMPTYYSLGGWPKELWYGCYVIAMLCAYYWILPFATPLSRAVSFALFLAHFYLSCIAAQVAPWYIPNVTFLSIFVIGLVAQQAEDKIRMMKYGPRAAIFRNLQIILYFCGVIVLISSLLLTSASGYQLKLQQKIIEDGNRREIGLWLKKNASSPKDRVFLECLGYIGFYSQLKMLDFPGLSSPEVVETRRKLKTDDFGTLIWSLHPEWLILRPWEISYIQEQMPLLLSTYYRKVRVFDETEKVNSYAYIPGRQYLQFDQVFTIYQLKK